MKTQTPILATFTLASLKSYKACESGYQTLVASLPSGFPEDQPINLLSALASNSVQDVFWALRAVEQDLSRILGPLSADIAEAVLPIFESVYPNDDRPRKAIEAARSGDSELAASAASDAAHAAYAASRAADAYYAASDAASRAASDAASDAAYAAAYAAYAASSAAASAYAAAAAASAASRAAYADFDQTLIKILKTYFSEPQE